MLAVGGRNHSSASSPVAGIRVSVLRVIAAGPTTGAAPGSRARLLPEVAVFAGAPETPGSALLFFRSLGEAATPCFRKRLDPRMCSKGAQKVTDMVADRFTA
jgi:hypothetical protein